MTHTLKSIRRCSNCNWKTHRKYWRDDVVCPICEKALGFVESMHGGLNRDEMKEARAIISKAERSFVRRQERMG